MMCIIVNAYACSPNMGSEPGMAWNWCINLAKYCELHIITEGEFRDKIEAALPSLTQADNMHFYYNPVTEAVRKMCWNQGDWRFYNHYKVWQYKTYEIALSIIKTTPIDIVHQLNMIGFREPGYLWKIKDIPFVWGPVDAKEKFPVSYLRGATIKSKLVIRLKNYLTRLQLSYSKRVRKAVLRASVVISASSDSQSSFNKFFNIVSPLLNETGCYLQDYEVIEKPSKNGIDLLWVGKLDFRKQLEIAIQALAATNNPNIRLHIVGSGANERYKKIVSTLNLTTQCSWYGTLTHKEVQSMMQKSDLFFFTSVAEGTPHVVLEAISNSLPVLCFDTCGQGDSVNEKVGIKIKLSSPSQSIKEFAAQLNYLASSPEVLRELSKNCEIRQHELSWEAKAKQMTALYELCLLKS